ncbi:hypothetical protein P0F65_12415 [Sphingomonas sp. I4]
MTDLDQPVARHRQGQVASHLADLDPGRQVDRPVLGTLAQQQQADRRAGRLAKVCDGGDHALEHGDPVAAPVGRGEQDDGRTGPVARGAGLLVERRGHVGPVL